MNFKMGVLSACILSASYPLYAQEIKEEKLVVSASGFAQQITDAPASITVISKEQLAKKPVHDLADAVKGVEGVSINGNANKQEITMRGLPGEYMMVVAKIAVSRVLMGVVVMKVVLFHPQRRLNV